MPEEEQYKDKAIPAKDSGRIPERPESPCEPLEFLPDDCQPLGRRHAERGYRDPRILVYCGQDEEPPCLPIINLFRPVPPEFIPPPPPEPGEHVFNDAQNLVCPPPSTGEVVVPARVIAIYVEYDPDPGKYQENKDAAKEEANVLALLYAETLLVCLHESNPVSKDCPPPSYGVAVSRPAGYVVIAVPWLMLPMGVGGGRIASQATIAIATQRALDSLGVVCYITNPPVTLTCVGIHGAHSYLVDNTVTIPAGTIIRVYDIETNTPTLLELEEQAIEMAKQQLICMLESPYMELVCTVVPYQDTLIYALERHHEVEQGFFNTRLDNFAPENTPTEITTIEDTTESYLKSIAVCAYPNPPRDTACPPIEHAYFRLSELSTGGNVPQGLFVFNSAVPGVVFDDTAAFQEALAAAEEYLSTLRRCFATNKPLEADCPAVSTPITVGQCSISIAGGGNEVTLPENFVILFISEVNLSSDSLLTTFLDSNIPLLTSALASMLSCEYTSSGNLPCPVVTAGSGSNSFYSHSFVGGVLTAGEIIQRAEVSISDGAVVVNYAAAISTLTSLAVNIISQRTQCTYQAVAECNCGPTRLVNGINGVVSPGELTQTFSGANCTVSVETTTLLATAVTVAKNRALCSYGNPRLELPCPSLTNLCVEIGPSIPGLVPENYFVVFSSSGCDPTADSAAANIAEAMAEEALPFTATCIFQNVYKIEGCPTVAAGFYVVTAPDDHVVSADNIASWSGSTSGDQYTLTVISHTVGGSCNLSVTSLYQGALGNITLTDTDGDMAASAISTLGGINLSIDYSAGAVPAPGNVYTFTVSNAYDFATGNDNIPCNISFHSRGTPAVVFAGEVSRILPYVGGGFQTSGAITDIASVLQSLLLGRLRCEYSVSGFLHCPLPPSTCSGAPGIPSMFYQKSGILEPWELLCSATVSPLGLCDVTVSVDCVDTLVPIAQAIITSRVICEFTGEKNYVCPGRGKTCPPECEPEGTVFARESKPGVVSLGEVIMGHIVFSPCVLLPPDVVTIINQIASARIICDNTSEAEHHCDVQTEIIQKRAEFAAETPPVMDLLTENAVSGVVKPGELIRPHLIEDAKTDCIFEVADSDIDSASDMQEHLDLTIYIAATRMYCPFGNLNISFTCTSPGSEELDGIDPLKVKLVGNDLTFEIERGTYLMDPHLIEAKCCIMQFNWNSVYLLQNNIPLYLQDRVRCSYGNKEYDCEIPDKVEARNYDTEVLPFGLCLGVTAPYDVPTKSITAGEIISGCSITLPEDVVTYVAGLKRNSVTGKIEVDPESIQNIPVITQGVCVAHLAGGVYNPETICDEENEESEIISEGLVIGANISDATNLAKSLCISGSSVEIIINNPENNLTPDTPFAIKINGAEPTEEGGELIPATSFTISVNGGNARFPTTNQDVDQHSGINAGFTNGDGIRYYRCYCRIKFTRSSSKAPLDTITDSLILIEDADNGSFGVNTSWRYDGHRYVFFFAIGTVAAIRNGRNRVVRVNQIQIGNFVYAEDSAGSSDNDANGVDTRDGWSEVVICKNGHPYLALVEMIHIRAES